MLKARKVPRGPAFGSEAEMEAKRQPGSRPPPANRAERWSLRRLHEFLGHPPITLELWDGSSQSAPTGESVAQIIIQDRRALHRLIANPGFEFGELYSAGRIEVDGDLAESLSTVYRSLNKTAHPDGLRGRFARTMALGRRNDRSRARHNISHHYDIGNDFYRLWLDRQMIYTCAYFTQDNLTLEQAQVAKLDHVCRKLQLKPGQRVVEAGCGWGALALHMARHYDVEVKAYNISREQIGHARELAREQGMDNRVEFIEDDSRNIEGKFDAFVSVGMLEHVGPDYYPALGKLIQQVLKEGGRGLIHTIGRDFPGPMNTWIQRRIFPGAYPPSLSEMMTLFEPNGLSVLDVENLRMHYARTLQHWLQRFEANHDRVSRMFDETFVRVWRLYLAGSMAAFDSGSLQLFQVVFSHSGDNSVPWTRDHLYRTRA